MRIRQRIFWNTFIRYALQSELKLLISACSVLALERSKVIPDRMNMIFPSIMLLALLSCPFIFYRAMMKNRDNLDVPSVKARIGTLYLGLRADREYVISYSLVFILRRVVFVLITFALFDYPGIQVQALIYSSLLYIIYIGHTSFHDPSSSKDLELMNEAIFLLICYHFVVFVNLLNGQWIKEKVGRSVVYCTAAILVINTSIIIIVSLKVVTNKLKII